MSFVAGAIPVFAYAKAAGVGKLIVAMHVVMPVVVHLAAERNSATVKPKKAKRPTVWPKIVVVIVKSILF